MAYQVYFADLTEENRALVLTLLRLKDEAGTLKPEEAELLLRLRGPLPAGSFQYQELETDEPQQQAARRRGRRRPPSGPRGNGRSQFSEN